MNSRWARASPLAALSELSSKSSSRGEKNRVSNFLFIAGEKDWRRVEQVQQWEGKRYSASNSHKTKLKLAGG